MKTILNINGRSYLLHPKADAAAVLENLRGMQPIETLTQYGPAGDQRYEAPFYHHRDVVKDAPARFGVELIADAQICTEAAWAELVAATEKAIADFNAAKAAEPISAGS